MSEQMKCWICGKPSKSQLDSGEWICNDCINSVGGKRQWKKIKTLTPWEIMSTRESMLESSRTKKKSPGCAVVFGWVVAIVVIILSLAVILGNNGSSPSQSPTIQSNDNVVYESSGLKVVFRGVTNVMGNVGLQFTLENKTDTEIMVLPDSASINDHMVTLLSGVPATIRPGKQFNQVWFTGTEAAGVSSYKDVTEIELVLTYGPSDALVTKSKKTKLIHIDVDK